MLLLGYSTTANSSANHARPKQSETDPDLLFSHPKSTTESTTQFSVGNHSDFACQWRAVYSLPGWQSSSSDTWQVPALGTEVNKHGAQAHIRDSTWKGFGSVKALDRRNTSRTASTCGNMSRTCRGRKKAIEMLFGPSYLCLDCGHWTDGLGDLLGPAGML